MRSEYRMVDTISDADAMYFDWTSSVSTSVNPIFDLEKFI
jgi:hypothetical protein